MLVVMEAAARPEQIEAVVRHIERLGFKAHPIPGAFRTAIGVTGHGGKADPLILAAIVPHVVAAAIRDAVT